MKLFEFVFNEDWHLRVCKDQNEAEKIFEQLYNFKVNGDSRRISSSLLHLKGD